MLLLTVLRSLPFFNGTVYIRPCRFVPKRLRATERVSAPLKRRPEGFFPLLPRTVARGLLRIMDQSSGSARLEPSHMLTPSLPWGPV